jgi:signal transduction histidine kinase
MTVEAQESTASESPESESLDAQKNEISMGRDDKNLCRDSSLKSVDKNGEDKNGQNQLLNISSSLSVDQTPSLSSLDNPYPPLRLAYMDGKENESEEFENKEDSRVESRLLLLKSRYKFPWLSETESLEYKKYSRMCFDVMSIGPLIFLITVFYCCHANFQYALVDGPFFISGLIFGVIASYQYYAFFLLGHTVRRYNLSDSSKSFLRSFELFFIFSSNFEDSIAIMATISASSYLYARVLNGQCAPDTTLWGSQRCNPVALSHSVPIDHMLYVSFFPLMHQLILRGISIHGVFACWVISTVFIIATVVHAEAWLELWSVYASLFILCTAFEHERFCRVCFFQSKRVKADDSRNIKRMVSQQKMEQDLSERNLLIERNKHEKEIQAIRTEEERKRMAFEHDQLVSLIGNVAHDLKTPLQSVGIDLESLKAKLTSVNDILMRWFNSIKALKATLKKEEEVVLKEGESVGERKELEFKNTDQEMRDSDILSLIDGVREGVTSVDYSCTFMKSAINRSLDFTKAAKNIVLNPSVSPFHIVETLNWPLKVE